MQKPTIFLLIVAVLIVIGLVLSFYGSQIITEDLSVNEGTIGGSDLLEVSAELDSEISTTAVYVVQTTEFEAGTISASVIDPQGNQIISESIESDSYEGRFDVGITGTYTLQIQNSGKETHMVGVIGHMPDTGKLSFGVTGFYILIMGLIGVVGVGIYAVRNKRKGV